MTRGLVSLSCATTPHPSCFYKSKRYKKEIAVNLGKFRCDWRVLFEHSCVFSDSNAIHIGFIIHIKVFEFFGIFWFFELFLF